jgi:tetratricopeptide (TPR) repeat protein
MATDGLQTLVDTLKGNAGSLEELRTWATEHLNLFDERNLEALCDFARAVEAPAQFSFALKLFDVLVFVCEKRQEPQQAVTVLLDRGTLLERLGILDDALDGYERALRIVAEHALGQDREYDCLVRKASLYQQAGLPRVALPLLERTVELASTPGGLIAYEALGNLASAHDDLGDHELALQQHQKALRGLKDEDELLPLSPTKKAMAIEYLNTGLTFTHLQRDEEALDCFRESAACFRHAAEHAGLAAYGGIVEFSRAVLAGPDSHEKANPYAREEATALIQLARAAGRLGRADESSRARDEAAQLVRRHSLESLVPDLHALYKSEV